MIYISGSNGLIGTELTKNIQNYIPISYRNQYPEINFLPNSTLIHLSSSITKIVFCSASIFKIIT